ncbi:MAG TPA: NAD(P)/FAD-dependent oxidoreductase [Casimicrobiaceae bacterium]|nr:NAD(P)/FAD-dependent oxidoreductase [Casimicrobiaceae bacterium]
MSEPPHVLVAGAGPVGLAAALTLADAGIAVTLAEKRPGLSGASKASTFHPPTLAILHRLGVLEEVQHRGQVADRVQYRTSSDGVFAEFSLSALKDVTPFPYRLHLEQAQVTPIMLERLRAHRHARVLFDAEVQHVAQHGPRVVMRVRHGAGHETLDGAFLVAADGSRSDVREALGIAFDGEEYPDKILRVMTDDDLGALLPGIAPVTYLWNGLKSASFLRMPDCWRIILRVPKEVDDAQALEPAWILPRLREVMPHIERLPNVVMKDIYGVSKRVASRYRDSRVILAGDSAHVTNTRGGMNMNCGIHDAYAIAGAIADAVKSGDTSRVEAAADERRRVATQMLIPRTDRNVAGGPAWLEHVRAMASNAAKTLAYLHSSAMLDMAPAA